MKATVTQVYKRISITPNRTDGILNYDEDNAYPNRIIDIVNNSGVASACVGMKARFLMGGGFEDLNFYKQKVNRKGLRVDQLLRNICNNFSLLPMVSIHVNYNALFQKIEVNPIPFQNIRLTTEDSKKYANMVALYDDWEKIRHSRVDIEKVDFINFYNPDPKVIQDQVDEAGGWGNYKGQVYFYSPKGKEYPLATFDSVLEDMQTDSKTKSFKFRNITTNFMASHILITDKIESEEDREVFIESIEQYQGADDALRVLHLEKSTPESTIDIKKIDIQDVEGLYSQTEESVRNSILLNFLIPPALLIQTAGKLGTSSEIEDATAYYNGIIYYEQLIIEEIFSEIFKDFATNINTTGNYKIVPFQAPVSKTDTANYAANIITLLTSALTPEQKKATLISIFNIEETDAIKLSGTATNTVVQ